MSPDFVGRCEEDQLKLEVERLKKELEEIKGSWFKPSTVSERCRSSFNNGLVEGERRVMKKAVEVIIKHWDANVISTDVRHNIIREFGFGFLSEEEKK